jgi:hypothetical protein
MAESNDDNASDRSAGVRYGLLAVAVVVVGLAGYLGYVVYPRFDLPAVEGAALLGLAAAAGIASFFSPCSFVIRPGAGDVEVELAVGFQACSHTMCHPPTTLVLRLPLELAKDNV